MKFTDLGPLRCTQCGAQYPVALDRWQCECAGPLDLDGMAAAARISTSLQIGLGQVVTPCLPLSGAANVWVKCEHLLPTGSFKDRGAEFLINLAHELSAQRIVIDSSGNAGASIAAYASRAGLPCEVFVPASAGGGKLRQIETFGAHLHRVPGPRSAAAEAAGLAAQCEGTLYAAHAWNPYFIAGVSRLTAELLGQLPEPPARIVVPVGSGTLLLGLLAGIDSAVAAGALARAPKLIAVQSEHCAPLAGRTPALPADGPLAEGIAIIDPPRAAQIRAGITRTGGEIVIVSDVQILAAQCTLARQGIYVEPTGAVSLAALAGRPAEPRPTVLLLTGAGWKSERSFASRET